MVSTMSRLLLRGPTWVVTSELELKKACQDHVTPAVLPTYTTAALRFAALMPASCLRQIRS